MNITPEQQALMRRILARFGPEKQLDKTCEECAELIVAIQKFKAHECEPTKQNLCMEIADVEIMCQQLRIIFGDGLVDDAILAKLERMRQRI